MDKPEWCDLKPHKLFIYACYVLITGLFYRLQKINGFGYTTATMSPMKH